MVLKNILEKLYRSGVSEYICEKDISQQIPHIGTMHYIDDVRSATFYACGIAQKENMPVVLIIRKEYLSSTLTGLTEAWFQLRRIIVIALGNDILNDDLNYFESCSSCRIKIQTLNDFEKYYGKKGKKYPEIYLIEYELEDEVSVCKIEASTIEQLTEYVDKVMIYEPLINGTIDNDNVVLINYKDKYGLLSKYTGYCVGKVEKNLLIIDESIIRYDINIFNNRYMNDRFKLVVIGKKFEENIIRWTEANNISFSVECDLIVATKKLLAAKVPSIVYIEKSEGR